MEHEDNAHLDNFLQSSPHLMENLQMASGDGMCDNAVAEEIGVGGNIGAKFEEHEDEEEWKYITEGQQSEKQHQQLKAGIDCKDLEGVEVGNGHGYELGEVGAEDMLLLDKYEAGNGVASISASVDADAVIAATGIEENEDIIKNDGDFSTTSNTTSTAGEDVDADTGVLQVEMKIESAPEEHLLPQHIENCLGVDIVGNVADETEEDEPSSMATTNTNGTSSLSENAPPPHATEENILKMKDISIGGTENADQILTNTSFDVDKEVITRPNDLDFDTHSQLNPNAMEFVPSFGSNPTSPVVPTSDNKDFVVGELALNSGAEIQLQPHPSTIPRHLLCDDDFLAQSPRKGGMESNLDGIALPEENDFEHEVATRPHELEQDDDDLIGVGMVQHSQQPAELLQEQLENHNNDDVHLLEPETNLEEDCLDFSRKSPISIIDHGPETSVDLDADIGIKPNDVEKVPQHKDISKEEPIEDLLNTVQPLPLDIESLNASFVEEPSQLPAEGKELLDVEEKENISHSLSTEEMQMNLQNDFNSSAKDIPQIPIDMDNAAHMQESFYIESTSSDSRHQLGKPSGADFENTDVAHFSVSDEIGVHGDENLNEGAHISLEQKLVFDDISVESTGDVESNIIKAESQVGIDPASPSLNIFAPVFTPEQKPAEADVITPSPISTEEKHLVEETKELTIKTEPLDELEQKMEDLELFTKDEILSQVEEVAQTAANIVESLNPFAAPEPEQHETVEQSPIEADHLFSTESQLHADFLQQNEQLYHNEQQELHQAQEPAHEQHEDNLFSLQPEDQPSASEAMLEPDLNGFEEYAPASLTITTPPEPELTALSNEPALEPTFAAHLEAAIAEPEPPLPLIEPEPMNQPEPETLFEPETKIVFEPELAAQPEPVHVPEADTEPALIVSNDIVSNVSINGDSLLVAPEEPALTAAVAASEPAFDEAKPSVDEAVVADETMPAAAAIGAIAAAAAVATVATTAGRKIDIKKPRTPTSTKSKAIDVKKTSEPVKKPIAATAAKTAVGGASTAARPRSTPSRVTTTVEKKPTAITKSSTTTATRKPLTSTAATTRTVTKTTTATRPTSAPTAAKLSAPRTTTATTARRSAPTSTGGSTTTSNGTFAAKSKPASGAPTKPTTLGLSATTKPKLLSPRTTLTSQARKLTPTSTTARSPLKTTAPTTNGVTKTSTTTATASRAKSSTSTTITTTTTKTFTARPAPKTTHSSTLTSTTTRRTVGSVSSSSTTGTRTATSMLQKKTPPGSTRLTTTGKSPLTSAKTSGAALKPKTKDVTKKPVTPIKSANEVKHKPAVEQPKTNGTASTGAENELGNNSKQQANLNGEGDGPQQLLENGMHHMELENGDGSLLEQHVEAALVDA
ncbi:205 kDa microtubule-associated protein [Anastrepha ludens]|uniref:205 kDa microtubule-associated protein n=1 Tax=Anastrepha ludens TaxID=28586 RepID=UPI0023AFF12E|nr:205 kDa microtubule-associated protein [Anastrepha ludens]